MSTLKVGNLQHPDSNTVSIQLNSAGAIVANNNMSVVGNLTTTGMVVPSSSYLRNRIINGDMRIDQRNAGASLTYGSTTVAGNYAFYNLDRWFAQSYSTVAANGAAFTIQRSTTAPAGFINSIVATVTTSQATLQTNSVYRIQQAIEGLNVSDFGWGTASAQSVTLSFWVRSSVTGTHSGFINNNAAGGTFTRYLFTYTISTANTWEYKTVTITGPTTGTWRTDNSAGMLLAFVLGASDSWKATGNSWANGETYAATGSVNVISTSSATFYITGVQLEVGTVATPFERRLYGQELALCQRYYFGNVNSTNDTGFYNVNSNNIAGSARFPAPMRATPTITIYNGSTSGQVALIGGGTGTVGSTNGITSYGFSGISGTNLTGLGGAQFNFTASAEL